jgi:hypothetical protein
VTQTLKERESTIEHLQNQLADRSAQVTSLQSQIEENVKSINLAYAKVAQRDDDHSKIQSALKETQGVLLQRDEKIRNLVDETQALREIAVNTVPAARVSANAPLASESVTQISGGFETRFANGNVNNPLLAASGDDFVSTLKEEVVPASLEVQAIAKSDEQVERSASNVLSLADRVRNLQSGMKKS